MRWMTIRFVRILSQASLMDSVFHLSESESETERERPVWMAFMIARISSMRASQLLTVDRADRSSTPTLIVASARASPLAN